MSDVTFSCPCCGQHIACDEKGRGQHVNCPACQSPITIPRGPVPPPLPKERRVAEPGWVPNPTGERTVTAVDAGRGRKEMAVASLVLGVFSCTCLGLLAGIPAVILGHMAFHRARTNPGRYAGAGLALAGFVTGYASLLITVAFLFTWWGVNSQAQRINRMSKLEQVQGQRQLDGIGPRKVEEESPKEPTASGAPGIDPPPVLEAALRETVRSNPALIPVRVLEQRFADLLPVSGTDVQPIRPSINELNRGTKFLIVDVALSAGSAGTYPDVRPTMGETLFSEVRRGLEAQPFKYVLNADNFILDLGNDASASGSFIKWPPYNAWCPDRKNTMSLVLGGSDACIFHSAWSLVIATNQAPETLRATVAFKVSPEIIGNSPLKLLYDPTHHDAVVPVEVTSIPSERETQPAAFGGTPQNVEVKRAIQPRFSQAMTAGPHSLTVVNDLDCSISLGLFCQPYGSGYQYGFIKGVPAGGKTVLSVPNDTFYVFWIREDKPSSRFRNPSPIELTGAELGIKRNCTLTIGAIEGETPLEEQF